MRIHAGNIHRMRTPSILAGLGDAYSDSFIAQAAQLGVSVPQGPVITSISKTSGAGNDRITITTDKPTFGLYLIPVADRNGAYDPGTNNPVYESEYNGLTSFTFIVPLPNSRFFNHPAGTYDMRAYGANSHSVSPTPTPFTILPYSGDTTNDPMFNLNPSVFTPNPSNPVSTSPIPFTTNVPPNTAYGPGVVQNPTASGSTPPSSSAGAVPSTPSTSNPSGSTTSMIGTGTPASSSGFALPAILTEESIGGIPNWVLALGAFGALWYFGSKK